MTTINKINMMAEESADRCFIRYIPPPSIINADEGTFQLGAKEDWMERVEYLTADIMWLLQLNQRLFWKQLVNNPEVMNAIVSFLQEATPYYVLETFPPDSDMWLYFQKLHYVIFLVFNRLATCTESPTESMTPKEVGDNLYRNYLVTVPIMMDLCMVYGKDNRSRIGGIIEQVFSLQPEYTEDLIKAIPFFTRVLKKVQQSFQAPVHAEMNGELKKLSERNGQRSKMSLIELRDQVLHVLDTAANLHIFLDVYTPGCFIFHDQLFESSIVTFYESVFPEMYRKVESLANTPKTRFIYEDLRGKLDEARIEMLAIFRLILASLVNGALEKFANKGETKDLVEDYVSVLTSSLTEKVFVQDYQAAYPIELDLDVLMQVSPEMDQTKCDYLIESVHACFDVPPERKRSQPHVGETYANQSCTDSTLQNTTINSTGSKKKVIGVELDSLITEVKDILPHLGDGFVQSCLEHYDYATDAVINAVLEGNLPDSLQAIDFSMPRSTLMVEEELAEQVGRLNVFDNDEFDVMTQDFIDTSKIRIGKKKMDHKNLNEMIDDKTHRSELREMYTKFGLVDTEGSMYDDDYDDTYDHVDVNVAEAGEQDRRAFVVPRVLRNLDKSSSEAEDSGGEEAAGSAPRSEPSSSQSRPATSSRADFVPFAENPEALRERAEQYRRDKQHMGQRREPPAQRDVVGAPKGHGQDKSVTVNRKNKTQRGNQNRRAGAARKRNQGMIPS